MDDDFADPFASLIQEVASSSSPAAEGAGKPAGSAEGQSPTPQAEGGAKPGATETSTAKPAAPAADPGAEAGKENRTADGQPPADGKGSLPEHLKPFESTLKTKGWDLSKPEGVVKALQSYQEAESNLGKRTSEAQMLHQRSVEVQRDFEEGLPGINRRLEALGYSKIEAPSLKDQHDHYRDLVNNINVALNGKATPEQRAAAIEKLNELAYDKYDQLRIQLASGAQKSQDFKAQRVQHVNKSVALFNERVGANPALEKAYDAILPHFQPGGVFHSLGLDEFVITSTPQRAQAMEKIGEALSFHASAYNPDGTVKEGGPIDVEVKKALALAGRQSNATPAGGSQNGAPPQSNGQRDALDNVLRELALEHA